MPELLILINGLPGAGKTTLADALGRAVGCAVISKDAIKEAVASALALPDTIGRSLGAGAMEMAWTLAAGLDGVVIVESWWFRPRDEGHVRAGIERVGAERVVELWCEVPADLALARARRRHRHAVHQDDARLRADWSDWARDAGPLELAPVVRVDTSAPVAMDDLAKSVFTSGAAATHQHEPGRHP